jgi:hypothetical protein
LLVVLLGGMAWMSARERRLATSESKALQASFR